MINSIFGQSPNTYRPDNISSKSVLPKTEPIVQTNFNSNGHNPNCPMFKNPNQKKAEKNIEFVQEKANDVFNPYCLACSQSLCRIKSLIESGNIDLANYNTIEPIIGTIINLEV